MKLFVWDLHGTLEQGNEDAVVELSNIILEKYGYSERLDIKLGKKLYGLRWHEYFEYLLPNEPHERHLELQATSFDLSNLPEGTKIIASYIKPSRNALQVLKAVEDKHHQIVLSNTVPESLPMFLKALNMLEFFDNNRALAVNQHTRESKRTKVDVLAEYTAEKNFEEIVVIGDSESDMALADAFNAKAYLYAHNGTPFRSEKGHYKINDLAELLSEI
ncbi:MAG: HAD family hydrolase [Candidatus Saccharibacteria bacterium]|nr:HAD family hydrolase [Candidatus Saccharibacteria bacterium]